MCNQGIVKVMLSLKPLGEDPSLPIPGSGSPKHSLACGSITPTYAFIFPKPSSLCVSVSSHDILLRISLFSLLSRMPVLLDETSA